MWLFRILAAVGLALSVATHGSTYFGVNPSRQFPVVWLLHLGIFVVFIPAILVARRMGSGPSKDELWQRVRRSCPAWLQGFAAFCFVYALFNFFICTLYLNEGGVPSKIDGDFVLHSHGKIIRKLTPEEFEKHQAYTVRGFSGHWMVFYCASLMTLIAARSEQRTPLGTSEVQIQGPA